MYCKNCGKETSDMAFCPHCGTAINTDKETDTLVSDSKSGFMKSIKTYGHEKLIRIILCCAAVANIIVRFVNNIVIVEYYVFAQDDYYVLSDTGRTWMLILFAVQLLSSAFLWYDAKKNKIVIAKKTFVLAAVLLAVQIIAYFIKIPAPY